MAVPQATKAYITQLSVMYLFAFELALAKETISTAECKRLVSALTKMPEAVQYVIDNCEDTCKFVATKLVATDSLLYIGRGLDYALSMEGSLKLKEVSYIHSESYAAGELKHGTISLIDEDVPVSPLQLRQVLSPRQSAMLLRLSQEVQRLFLFVQTPVQENSRTVLRIMLSKFRIQTSFLCRLQRLFRSRFLLITHQSTEVLIPISQRTLLSRLL